MSWHGTDRLQPDHGGSQPSFFMAGSSGSLPVHDDSGIEVATSTGNSRDPQAPLGPPATHITPIPLPCSNLLKHGNGMRSLWEAGPIIGRVCGEIPALTVFSDVQNIVMWRTGWLRPNIISYNTAISSYSQGAGMFCKPLIWKGTLDPEPPHPRQSFPS